MLFIPKQEEPKTFQNIQEKQRIFVLEEQVPSLGMDTPATLFLAAEAHTALLRLRASSGRDNSAELRVKHLPGSSNNPRTRSEHNCQQNRCFVSLQRFPPDTGNLLHR